MDENMYFTWKHLMGYYPSGFRIFIAVGEGGVGKTYDALRTCKNKLKRKADRKFLLVRDNENVLDAFNSEDGKNTLVKHFCSEGETIKLEKDDLWLCDVIKDIKSTKSGELYDVEILEKKRHLGSMAALSTFYKQKGIERAQAGYDVIFIDEFIPESRQADRIDTARAFYRTLQSTLRTKPDACVLMAANLVNDTPLWQVLGVKPGPIGSITLNKETGVVIQHVKPTDAWLSEHEKSVAGRLKNSSDYNTVGQSVAVNPVHRKDGVMLESVYMKKLTKDGTDVVWLCKLIVFNGKDTMSYTYVCSDGTGNDLYTKFRARGARINPMSKVPVFGFVRRPPSDWAPLKETINYCTFESQQVLKKYENILK